MSVRVDKWLWSVRVYKTRSQAIAGAKAGKVLVNNEVAKPSTKVVIGDTVEARLKERTVIYQVVQILEKRVGAAVAVEAYDDHSPAPVPSMGPRDSQVGVRERGQGRPTKRDRREIQRLRGRP